MREQLKSFEGSRGRERGPMIGISMALKYAQTMLKDLTALKNVFPFLVAA